MIEEKTFDCFQLYVETYFVRNNNLYVLGTTVQAKNLFKLVPVRRQMITDTRKANQVVKSLETLMQCFGICKPNVRIQYRVNNNLVFIKPSLNNIKESVTYVLGRKITSNMEWIEPEDADVRICNIITFKKLYFKRYM